MLEYIKNELEEELRSGRVVVLTEIDPWFERIAKRFPMGLNRIAWENVPDKESVVVLDVPRQIDSEELQVLLSIKRDVIESWFRRIPPNTEVIWLGDNSDVGLRMPLTVFLSHLPVLFSLPQHAYVLPEDAAWCLNYVMEGEVFFGTGA